MRYISTRGQAPHVSFFDAVLNGMAPDGGLYVPESWPAVFTAAQDRCAVARAHFSTTAASILKAFAGDDLSNAEAGELCAHAYVAPAHAQGGWKPAWGEAVTPLRQFAANEWMLELFHGPSLSFKDVAMQLIGPLYDFVLSRRDQRLTVLCATSGDTGGAAVEALKGRSRIDLFVLTPAGRVSEVQRRFMTTSAANNVRVIELLGDFDDCQAIVKGLFLDAAFAERARLSGVNSINWARIVAQSVYFQIASTALCGGGPVNFVVPTGNFGDAYSGWVAKQMGAPIGDIVIGANANDILFRALETGRYERRQSIATLSPAIDIQVASNFERVLFEALDRDADAVRGLYGQFTHSGGFDIPASARTLLARDFAARSTDDDGTLMMMKSAAESGDIICPHTAIAIAARAALEPDPGGPVVSLATAHPAKFPETVARATGAYPQLPARCADLFERQEVFDTLPADIEQVKRYIHERSRAWV